MWQLLIELLLNLDADPPRWKAMRKDDGLNLDADPPRWKAMRKDDG